MKLKINSYKFVIIIVFLSLPKIISSQELAERITPLDRSDFVRRIYRFFRTFLFHFVGRTGQNANSITQEIQEEFPCDISGMRSKSVPQNVHKLKPGDIDVIAALGDSLTAASGAASVKFSDVIMENRGLSWCIGGQWNWHNVTTLPNILKEFNPNLVGYSKSDSYPFHEDSQFNLAEIGASSVDLPFMAKSVVSRIKMDKRIDFRKTWKMVTICIGGNDICSFLCTMKNPESFPEKHRIRLIKTLRYFRDNMPRTFINIVPVPLVRSVVLLKDKPLACKILHHSECACWIGNLYNQTTTLHEKYNRIQENVIRIEEEVAKLNEFRNLSEFAVVYQPFTKSLNLSTANTEVDYSLLAYDCFHMSQKGNAWAGVALWNNLLEPIENKTEHWNSPKSKFLCPTKETPYIYTNDN